jgi:Ca2+-binding EF-hand superfamily protein
LISVEELQHAFVECGLHVEAKEIEETIKRIDYIGNGKINYSEFLAATISI